MYRHLEGKDEYCCDVVGLYAIMQDNNCAFLCADFDDKNCKYGYKEDVTCLCGCVQRMADSLCHRALEIGEWCPRVDFL